MRQVLLVASVFLAGWFAARAGGPSPASAAAGPPDFRDVVASADPGVVRILVRNGGASGGRSRDEGVGAGFVIDAQGLVLTSRHVVAGAQRLIVTFPRGGAADAHLVGQDEATDTALLRVNATGLTALPIGNPRALRVGQWVLACGSPYNLPNSWSVGIVSGLGRDNVGVGPRTVRDFIQTDAAANLGNSGGPLLDADGRVVGVMTAILSRTGGHQGVSLAVPIDTALGAVQRMRRGGGGMAPRPSLGLRVRPSPSPVGDTPGGLLVTGFDPRSSAADAGLAAGDVILVAEGIALRHVADLQRIVLAHKPGDVLALTVQRGTRRFRVRVVVR
jgi:serine protease Do